MRNTFLKDKVAGDIERRVARVLKDLGNPEPPLRLELVREVLKLDLRYYTKDDPGALDEMAHRLKVAGKQVIRRPTLILDVVKKLDLRALYLPDSKRILVDSELPAPKQRWSEAHEVGHDLAPWHHEMMLGDNRLTLSPACHAKLENEANYAAGRLLFLQDRFDKELRSGKASVKRIQDMAKAFGNTITTTLWRSVEHLLIPAVGLITSHPTRSLPNAENGDRVRYFIRSRAFEERFSNIHEDQLFTKVIAYCTYRTRGPLGDSELVLLDDNETKHVFSFETFFNGYDALTLGTYMHAKNKVVVVA